MEHQAMSSVTQEAKKKCPRCEKEGRDPMRPVSEFEPNKSKRDGLQTYCRPCNRAYEREYREKRATQNAQQQPQQQQVVVVAPQQDDYIIPEDNREYIYLTYADAQVPLDPRESSKRMVNVTEMFKASGAPEHKKPYQWFNQEQTQELIEELLKVSEAPSITETRKSGREGQRGGGSTWYCEELALAYAMYLSPALHLACLRFVLEHWHGGPALPAPQADDCTVGAQRELSVMAASLDQMGKTFTARFDEMKTLLQELQSTQQPAQVSPEPVPQQFTPEAGFVYVTCDRKNDRMAIGQSYRHPSDRMKDKDYNGAKSCQGIPFWDEDPLYIITDDRVRAEKMFHECVKRVRIPTVGSARGTFKFNHGFVEWFQELHNQRLSCHALHFHLEMWIMGRDFAA
jgi:hypothetical protein